MDRYVMWLRSLGMPDDPQEAREWLTINFSLTESTLYDPTVSVDDCQNASQVLVMEAIRKTAYGSVVPPEALISKVTGLPVNVIQKARSEVKKLLVK